MIDAFGHMGRAGDLRLAAGFRLAGVNDGDTARRVLPYRCPQVLGSLVPNRPDNIARHPPEDYIVADYVYRRDHAEEIREATNQREARMRSRRANRAAWDNSRADWLRDRERLREIAEQEERKRARDLERYVAGIRKRQVARNRRVTSEEAA